MFLILNKKSLIVHRRGNPASVSLFLWGCDGRDYLVIHNDKVVDLTDVHDITTIERKLDRVLLDTEARRSQRTDQGSNGNSDVQASNSRLC